MNDSPGWAAPGSSPSDDSDRGTREQPDQSATGEAPVTPATWSRERPPAGQWTAPAGGPTPPAGGWGGPGGWGGGWARPPAAAKPGIIPLRPLGVGEILDGAVSTMRAHWRTVLGISLAVAIVTQALITLSEGLWFRDLTGLNTLRNNPDPTVSEMADAVGGTYASTGVAGLIGILGSTVVTAMLTVVVSRAVLGRSVSMAEAWRNARPQLPRLLGLLFLVPLLIVTAGALALAPGLIVSVSGAEAPGAALAVLGSLGAVVAGIWLWIRYCLAGPALMLEKQGVIESMRRSAKLVRGAWWRIFGIQLLTLVLVMFVGFAIQIPIGIVAMFVGGEGATSWLSGETTSVSWAFLVVTGVGAMIGSTITYPIVAGVTALVYMDQRIRREALDLELARAAGLPGYSTPDTGTLASHDTAPGG